MNVIKGDDNNNHWEEKYKYNDKCEQMNLIYMT